MMSGARRVLVIGWLAVGWSSAVFSQHACSVNDISVHGQFTRGGGQESVGILFYSVTQPADTSMSDYLRDPGGQWPLDLNPRNDAGIDLVLATPHGPYRVSLQITIDGVPFRQHQEQGMVAAFRAARQAADAAPRLDAADQGPTAAAVSTAETDDADADGVPVNRVQAESYRRSDVGEKLAGYLRSQTPIPSDVSAANEELQWMVSQWLPGGRVLIAAPKFGLQHSRTATLCRLLGFADGRLSESEIAAAIATVEAADRDGNQIVSLQELEAAARQMPPVRLWNAGTLLRRVDSKHEGPSDVTFSLQVLRENSRCVVGSAPADVTADQTHDRIIHATPFGRLQVVPVLDKRTAGSFLESGQFSIGAMLVPDPLLHHLDARADGQLDTREISQIPERLRSLDKNSDGQITPLEIPMTIILVVSQGPWANRLLAQIGGRKASPNMTRDSVEVPQWFRGMDSNGDGLLARTEFLGSDEQFEQADSDSDGVISGEEARDD